MKRILITGANSYIGTWVEAYLSRFPGMYRVKTVDLCTPAWKEESFQGYDAVLHVAGIVHQKDTKDDPAFAELYSRVNGILPCEVAQKAKQEGVGQFLFMSTQGVYGCDVALGQTMEITAQTPLNPRDNYGRSKLEAEVGLQALAGDGFRLAILRPPIIYGKGCKGNYVPLARLAKRLPVFPKIENRRSMLYIENFAEFVRLAVEHELEGIFCPQDAEYVDVGIMAQEIARAHGKKLLLVPGFTWALKLLRRRVQAVDKAFGSLIYARELSTLPWNYCVRSMEEAIRDTEA